MSSIARGFICGRRRKAKRSAAALVVAFNAVSMKLSNPNGTKQIITDDDLDRLLEAMRAEGREVVEVRFKRLLSADETAEYEAAVERIIRTVPSGLRTLAIACWIKKRDL
jgi:hypothetical protein